MDKRLFTFMVMAGVFLCALPSHAQKKTIPLRQPETCEILPEVISNLYAPKLAMPTVWDAIYGVLDSNVQFASGVPLKNGNILVLARILPNDQKASIKISLIELNNRSRAVVEKNMNAKNKEIPLQLLAAGSGYAVLSNMRDLKSGREQVRVSWYDAAYMYKREMVYSEASRDYTAAGLIPNPSGKGFLLFLNASSPGGQTSAIVISIDDSGKQIWKRDYVSGAASEISGLHPMPDGGYVLSGRSKLENNRWAGWLSKIDGQGILMWQQVYPRGLNAVIKNVQSFVPGDNSHGYLIAGETRAANDGLDAIWIGKLDEGGDRFEWQRYIRRQDNGFSLADFTRLEDGRMELVVNTLPTPKSGQRAHIRMLTLKKRGPVMQDLSYLEGVESSAVDARIMTAQPDKPYVVIANIMSDDKPMDIEMIGNSFIVRNRGEAKAVQDQKGKQMSRGWIFVTSAPEAYRDPCDDRVGP